MKLVVRVKLLPEADQAAALHATLRTVNEAACWVSGVAFERGVPREYELRKHTYAELKARGLGAQAAQHTIKKVRDAYTALKANIRAGNLGRPGSKRRVTAESKPITFRPQAAQPYDERCLSWQYDAGTVSIWTTAGRLKSVRFTGSQGALKRLREHRRGESDLVERDGAFYLIATCEVPENPVNDTPVGFVGVDLGIVNIATTSTGYRAAGRGLNRHRKRQADLRKKLQAKGTKSAKRLLKKRSRKEQRHTANVNHVIAKTIVTTAERTGHGIALEDLTGIRDRVRLRKGQRTRLHSWGFPARPVHRLQGQARRRPTGPRRSGVHQPGMLPVSPRRPEEPRRPGDVRMQVLRGHAARGHQRSPQHRPQRRDRVDSGA